MTTIRPARASDAEEVVPLLMDAIQDISYQLTGAATKTEAIERLKQFFVQEANRLSYEHVLIKEADGEVAGMILCYHGQHAEAIDKPLLDRLRELDPHTQPLLDQEAEKDEYYIDSLAVSPRWRGQGIATELIAYAEQHAQEEGYLKIALNVELNNERAHALYYKLGYRTDKEIQIHGKPYAHMVKAV